MNLKDSLQEHYQLFFPKDFYEELVSQGVVDLQSAFNVIKKEYIKKVYKYILNDYQLIDNYGGVKFKGNILKINPKHDLYSNGENIKFCDHLGCGAIDALFKAFKNELGNDIEIYHYGSSATNGLINGFDETVSSESKVMTIIGIKTKDNKLVWGVGESSNALRSAVDALLSAINRLEEKSQL
jgi:hypothetical protein